MKKELGYVAAVIFLLTEAVPGGLHFDVSGGISLQSEYRYYHDQPAGDGAQWLTFDPLNSFCALSRWSIDVWKDRFRFGVSSGFMRRYELRMHTNNGDESIREKTGEMLSVPVICFMEGRLQPFFYEFGLGPFITRFNYSGSDLPEFSVTTLFGFLFGGGYEHRIFPGVNVVVGGELLVNAPVFLVDYLDEEMKNAVHDSRYPEYNSNDFQTVVFNAAITIGLQYEFGNKIRIPLDDGIDLLRNSGIRERIHGILKKRRQQRMENGR